LILRTYKKGLNLEDAWGWEVIKDFRVFERINKFKSVIDGVLYSFRDLPV
jgi:hypothetical protein